MIRAAIAIVALPAALIAQQLPKSPPASAPSSAPVYAAAWTVTVETPVPLWLAIGQHAVFLASQAGITAHARTDGKVLWTHEIAGVTSVLAATGDSAPVVAVTAKEVVALDPQTAQERFRVALPDDAPPAYIALMKNDLLTVASGKSLRAYRGDGGLAWSATLPAAAVTPVVAQEATLWVGTDAPALIALDSSGVVTHQIPLQAPARTIVALANEVYVSAAKPALARYRTGDTKPSWQWTRGLSELVGGPIVGDKVIYVAGLDNTVQQLDRDSGSVKWRKPLRSRPAAAPREAGQLLVIPLISGDVALVDSADNTFRTFADLKLDSDARLQDFEMDESGTIYIAVGSLAATSLTAWRPAAPAKSPQHP